MALLRVEALIDAARVAVELEQIRQGIGRDRRADAPRVLVEDQSQVRLLSVAVRLAHVKIGKRLPAQVDQLHV